MAPQALVVDLALWVVGTAFVLTWWQRPMSGPSDAVAHMVLFGSLTLTALAVATARWRLGTAVPLVAVGVVGLSVASEGTQWTFVNGRNGSLEDVGFDLVGITLGALVFFAVRFVARGQAAFSLALISAGDGSERLRPIQPSVCRRATARGHRDALIGSGSFLCLEPIDAQGLRDRSSGSRQPARREPRGAGPRSLAP